MGVIPPDTQLTPRPAEIPAWDSLSAQEQTVYTTLMENYAGYMAHTDYHVGRLIDSPFQWTKQVASHFGGTRNPMVVPWDTNSRYGDFEESPWELYNIEEDFSQANDLAAENPAKLKQLQKKEDS
jgi:arylsulfatase A-like enzyme